MLRLKARIVPALLVLVFIAGSASALTIKVGSLAPLDTPWDAALHRLAAKWNEITNGEVQMKIFGGGIAGDEADMLRKVRLGDRLQAAALSGTGLNRITSDLLVMSLPLFFDSYDELETVMRRSTPMFEELVAKKRFKLVAWTAAGWVHFFGKQPVITPSDLKKQKLAVSAEDEEILYAWRAMGFDALPLHTTEILAGLQTGMAEAFHTPPIVAAVYQWFGLAQNMSDMPIAPLVAGLVMNERTWRRIPSKYQDPLLQAAAEILGPLYDDVQDLEQEAIEIMLDNGLTINEVGTEAVDRWKDIVVDGYDLLVGSAISEEVYETVKAYRDEYRASHGSR